MEKEERIHAVQQIYADFGKQNIEGVLNSLTEDIRWNDGKHPDIPYSKKRDGKNEVVSFFMELGSTLVFTAFTPQEFYGDNDAVIVTGSFAGKAIATGKSFAADWVHLWKFRGEKIFSFQAFNNTAAMIAAIK